MILRKRKNSKKITFIFVRFFLLLLIKTKKESKRSIRDIIESYLSKFPSNINSKKKKLLQLIQENYFFQF